MVGLLSKIYNRGNPPSEVDRGLYLKRNMLAALVIVVVVAAAILLTPVALGSAVTVPLAKIPFSVDTSSGSVTLGGPCYNSTEGGSVLSCGSASSITVYEYYFLTRPGGVVRNTDTNVNSTAGSANITITMFVSTPAGQQVKLGNTTISGGVGNRTEMVYLSVDQGVRASGQYTLTVSIDASIKLAGSTKSSTVAAGFETTFKVP